LPIYSTEMICYTCRDREMTDPGLRGIADHANAERKY